jgi:hypothetical protein
MKEKLSIETILGGKTDRVVTGRTEDLILKGNEKRQPNKGIRIQLLK